MQLRTIAPTRSLALMLASTAIIFALSVASAIAQPRDVAAEARPLLLVARTFLSEALAREEDVKRRGSRRLGPPASFPLPMCLFEGGLCGAVNRDGSIAVEPRFDFVDNFHEGRALVRSGGLYGYVDRQGRLVVEPQYPIAGRYRLGLAEVDVDGRSALIDLEGRQVLAPHFASAIPFTKNVFWVNDGVRSQHTLPMPYPQEFPVPDGLRPPGYSLRSNAKWGLIDASGTWIRTPEFRDIAGFDPENENLMWAQASTGWGLIRPDGTWAAEPTFEDKRELSDNRAAVRRGGKMGFIDRTGQIVIPLKFDNIGTVQKFEGGMPVAAKLGRLVGLIDRSGEWVLEPAYDSISSYGGDAPSTSNLEFKGFVAKRGNWTDLLDASGGVLISGMKHWPNSSYDEAIRFCADGRIIGFMDRKPRLFDRDGTRLDPPQGEMWWPLTCDPPYVVKVGGRFVHVDRWLRPLTLERFDAVGPFQHGLATVVLHGRYGLIRPDGTWAIEPKFDRARPFRTNIALVKEDGRAGLINATTGTWITTQAPFDDVCPSEYGVAGVMLNGKAGAVDETGAWVIEPKYDAVRFGFGSGLVPVRAGDKWGFVDASGKEVIEARFDDVTLFNRGVSWTRSGGERCAIDRRGSRIPTLSCQSATPTNVPLPQNRPSSCHIAPLKMPEAPP